MRIYEHDCPGAGWRRSSYSGGNEGGSNCVEVAGTGGLVGVRDSKNPQYSALVFGATRWRAFISELKAARG
jgi:hypothetical protein